MDWCMMEGLCTSQEAQSACMGYTMQKYSGFAVCVASNGCY